MRVRKKPVEVDAIRWTGDNVDEILIFCEGCAVYQLMSSGVSAIVITTLETNDEVKMRHAASINDWIIKGVQGEFYPCEPDIFDETYEVVIGSENVK